MELFHKDIYFSKQFAKNYTKRILPNKSLVIRFEERLKIFTSNRNSPILRDHALKGLKANLRSFSVGGDLRVIYKINSKGEIYFEFLDIGSHNQVY